jgi:hypothetical protein
MPTSSIDVFYPKNKLLKVNQSLSNGEEITSGWQPSTGSTAVVGFFIADNGSGAANADLVIEQSIDKSESDITDVYSPTAAGDGQILQVGLMGRYVKATVFANQDISKVRTIVYKSTVT